MVINNMGDQKTLIEIISEYKEFIGLSVALIAGWVNLKAQSVRNKDDITELKARLERLENRLDTKLDDVQKDIKEILILIGGKR